MQCSMTEVVYWHNVTPKDDKTASTAPANATYSYKICIKGIDVVLVPDNAVSSLYMEGDAVWVENLYGRCMTQFDEGTVTRVNSQHSVSVDGIPCHIRDLRPACRKDCSISDHITSSDEEALMIYEHPSESDAPNIPGQDEDSDVSEDSTTKEVPETVLLRQSTRQKWSAPHCNLCDLKIREKYGGHARKCLRTASACFNRAHI